jgi:hypothetical protein
MAFLSNVYNRCLYYSRLLESAQQIFSEKHLLSRKFTEILRYNDETFVAVGGKI